jgi:hypothetical protein
VPGKLGIWIGGPVKGVGAGRLGKWISCMVNGWCSVIGWINKRPGDEVDAR